MLGFGKLPLNSLVADGAILGAAQLEPIPAQLDRNV